MGIDGGREVVVVTGYMKKMVFGGKHYVRSIV